MVFVTNDITGRELNNLILYKPSRCFAAKAAFVLLRQVIANHSVPATASLLFKLVVIPNIFR